MGAILRDAALRRNPAVTISSIGFHTETATMRDALTPSRPLSPHLQVYRWPITMAMSIAHRVTGGALYVGTLLLVWLLVAAASGQSAYNSVSWVFGSFIGKLILFGYTWALFHHMLGGIRHFVWDTGRAMEPGIRETFAWANLAGSVALAIILWAIAWAAR
jgi:succinate dehydrogenase / fumarate reductase, cytochrome b subunit